MNRLIQLLMLLFLSLSCVTETSSGDTERLSDGTVKEDPETTRLRQELVEAAYSLLGKEQLYIRGKEFPVDCTGTVAAIYYKVGIDLFEYFPQYTGGGVTRVYKTLDDRDLIYYTKMPLPGDIIFWDNTWDSNGDGKWNDALTHTGMVVEVKPNGDIVYIHDNYRKGIILEHMNLYEPETSTRVVDGETVRVNSGMRMRSQIWENGIWSAGQLLRDFGKGYLLP